MKNKLFIPLVAILALLVIINLSLAAAGGDSCHPTVKLVNQDPNPATPADYVKVLFEISGLENPNCVGMSVQLKPEYPFSLDPGEEGIRTLKGNTYTPEYNSNWNVPFKIRIADDALEGDYSLKLLSRIGDENTKLGWTQNYVNISITDAQTEFDTVIQGVTGTQYSIGIVNTGKNTANSLVIGIPQQEQFSATGTTQQIVGNLAAGDYTIVSFDLVSKFSRNASWPGWETANGVTAGGETSDEAAQPQKFNGEIPPASEEVSPANAGEPLLKIKIDYTDGIGKRRSVIKEIPISSSLLSGNLTGRMPGQTAKQSSSIFGITIPSISNWWYALGIVLLLLAGGIAYKKYKQKKGAEGNNKHEKNSENIPGWVSAEKSHNKK